MVKLYPLSQISGYVPTELFVVLLVYPCKIVELKDLSWCSVVNW